MDISGLGASKLLEALEKLGVSKGAELRSLGPQGEPPAELVRAFEDALRAPDGQGGSVRAGRCRRLAGARAPLRRPVKISRK